MKPSRYYRLTQAMQILSGAIMASSVLFSGAGAHDAMPTAAKPLGWSYPFSCCSGYDCREIGTSTSSAPVRVYETAMGYRFNTSMEIVAYDDKRVKESPDGKFHWCTVAGKDDGRTICLFVPPRGF